MVNRQRNNRKTSKRKRNGGASSGSSSWGNPFGYFRSSRPSNASTTTTSNAGTTIKGKNTPLQRGERKRKIYYNATQANGCTPGNANCSTAAANNKQTTSDENLKRSINFYYTFVIGNGPPSNSNMANMLLLYRDKTPIKVLYDLNNTYSYKWKTIIDPNETDAVREHNIDMVAKNFNITVTPENTLIDQLHELDLLERKKLGAKDGENDAADARKMITDIEPGAAPEPGGGGRKKRKSKRKSNKKLKKKSRRRNRRKR